MISSKVSKLLSKALHNPHHIANAPAVPDHLLKPQELPLQGLLPMAPPSLGKAGTNPVLTASVAGPVIQHVLTPLLSTSQTTSTATTEYTMHNFLAWQHVDCP